MLNLRVNLPAVVITVAILGLYFFPNLSETTKIALIIAIPSSLLAISYVLVPIRLYRNHQLSARYEFEVFHPAREVMPEEAWSHIRETAAALVPCGFKVAAHFRTNRSGPKVIGYATLMESDDHSIVANLNSTFITKPKAQNGYTTFGFFTESADGTVIMTANNPILAHAPHAENRIVLWLPDIRFPDELLEYHLRLVAKFAVEPKRDVLNRDPAGFMQQLSKTQADHWVKTGYYKLDREAEVYRLTWQGAILTAWKQLWPIKPIRRAWRKHQTNKLLRKLEE